jgi:trk system potassium uptake protein TrkA
MYILIAGDNEVAYHIAELLMDKHQVVLIGPQPGQVPRLERLDVELVEGECTSASVLRSAHIGECGVFVASTDYDEQNLVACIAAQRLGARRSICLLSRPGFVTVSERDDALAESLGIDAVVRPSEQLAREILRIVTVPGALDLEHLVHGRVRLLRHLVEEGAPITRYPLRQLALPDNVVLVMKRRGEDTEIPQGHTSFAPGDKVTAMGTARGIHDLRYRFLRSRAHGRDRNWATIVGGGVVGLAVAKGLEASGWRVKLIELSGARCREIAPQIKGVVLHGDGTDLDLLEEEQVADAPVLIAVTSNDEKNLLVSLIAKKIGVERIITRAERLANEKLFEQVGIDVVRSARGAAIRKVVRDVVDAQSAVRLELEHGDVHVVELELPESFPPTRLRNHRWTFFAIVGTVVRGRQVIIPDGNTIIQPGDHLMIFTSSADEGAVLEHFSEAADADGSGA